MCRYIGALSFLVIVACDSMHWASQETALHSTQQKLLGRWSRISTRKTYCDSNGTATGDSIIEYPKCAQFFEFTEWIVTQWDGPDGRNCYDTTRHMYRFAPPDSVVLEGQSGLEIGAILVCFSDDTLTIHEIGNCSPVCVGLCAVSHSYCGIMAELPLPECGKSVCEH